MNQVSRVNLILGLSGVRSRLPPSIVLEDSLECVVTLLVSVGILLQGLEHHPLYFVGLLFRLSWRLDPNVLDYVGLHVEGDGLATFAGGALWLGFLVILFSRPSAQTRRARSQDAFQGRATLWCWR